MADSENSRLQDLPSSKVVARSQRADSEQEEVRQSAVNALHKYSILAMHAIASEESPAQTRLRMLRYLTDGEYTIDRKSNNV
ncbi:3407_t:CDS:2 [Scutellospora calospora]|uniref:3407_t:CDS:1 n=1 Tax=Scutellospora calospora TaxID=85575 RepID=A0ACA9JUF9_9GLOM|nr:3407_t:CDS:2 [Scutellospora calospora]